MVGPQPWVRDRVSLSLSSLCSDGQTHPKRERALPDLSPLPAEAPPLLISLNVPPLHRHPSPPPRPDILPRDIWTYLEEEGGNIDRPLRGRQCCPKGMKLPPQSPVLAALTRGQSLQAPGVGTVRQDASTERGGAARQVSTTPLGPDPAFLRLLHVLSTAACPQSPAVQREPPQRNPPREAFPAPFIQMGKLRQETSKSRAIKCHNQDT